MKASEIPQSDYHSYFKRYIDLVKAVSYRKSFS